MSSRKGSDFANTSQASHLSFKLNNFVPLWLVPDKVHLDSGLFPRVRVSKSVNNAGWEPLSHLVKHVYPIVHGKVGASAPLLLHSSTRKVDQLVIFRSESREVNENFVIVFDAFDFSIAPLFDGVEAVHVFAHTKVSHPFSFQFIYKSSVLVPAYSPKSTHGVLGFWGFGV